MAAEMHQPLIIVAPNGARRMKSDHPALPISPEELADTALTCAEAGAAMIHMHARTQEGRHSLEIKDNERTYDAVKSAVGERMIVQMTTEAVGLYPPAAQMQLIRALKPEAASFGLRELIPDTEHEPEAARFFHWVAEQQILAQYILYSAQDLEFYRALLARKVLPAGQHHLLFVLGRYSAGQQSTPADLEPFFGQLDAIRNTRWAVCAFGAQEHDCLIHGIKQGGDARIGFENNLLSAQGELAADNAAQVRELCDAVQALGYIPLSAAQARADLTASTG